MTFHCYSGDQISFDTALSSKGQSIHPSWTEILTDDDIRLALKVVLLKVCKSDIKDCDTLEECQYTRLFIDLCSKVYKTNLDNVICFFPPGNVYEGRFVWEWIHREEDINLIIEDIMSQKKDAWRRAIILMTNSQRRRRRKRTLMRLKELNNSLLDAIPARVGPKCVTELIALLLL